MIAATAPTHRAWLRPRLERLIGLPLRPPDNPSPLARSSAGTGLKFKSIEHVVAATSQCCGCHKFKYHPGADLGRLDVRASVAREKIMPRIASRIVRVPAACFATASALV